ncbi:AraC family transcriptional regulator [Paenibacillus arenilitoris]|uniref:Helix-turn-helix transcriptional regulator n=1 Tax=Paenibacillus arenilitoris TaxID=2772299 RepID=A0A927CMV1_9BACL|nr:AraC family transcriptional regulator [Paenibacillus arenilitoris]MBD2870929.1 helix-turn-helix transcriptional regulator [Paenibacillus arenilitoris]
MTSANNSAIPKEKLVLAKKYPIQVDDTIGVTSYYQKLHWHDVLEINLIKAGTGYYIINGRTFEFQQGDILLINSNDLHCAYETKDLVMLVVSFDAGWFLNSLRTDPAILSPFKEMGVSYTNLLDRDNPRIGLLRSLLLELQDEHLRQESSYESVVFALMLRFLATVNRHFRTEIPGRTALAVNARQLEKIRVVIHAMEQNYAHAWTLSELASLVYLSPSRFSDLFRLAVGMPPMLYLIHIRLESAVAMLESNTMKITDIAHECGFRSLSNFNRLFKKHIGAPPKTARNKSS